MGGLYRSAGIVGRAAAMANAALLVVLPVIWALPLIESRSLIFFSNEVSIYSGAAELYRSDLFLFAIVVVFAMLVPYAKVILYVYVWFVASGVSAELAWAGYVLARLSMTDVFLFALLLLVVKGTVAADIVVRNGLYAFSMAVVASVVISIITDTALARRRH